MSELQKTPIVDKNGKQTTVNKRVDEGVTKNRVTSLPNPMPSNTEPDSTKTDEELLASITMLEKKVKRLSKLGAGAGMATAANNSYLRKMTAEANLRGIL